MPEISWETFAGNARAALDRKAEEEKERQRQEAYEAKCEGREVKAPEANTPVVEGAADPDDGLENFNFIIPLARYIPEDEADAAYENGLKDPDWVAKGPGHFLEFNRRGKSFDDVAADAFFEVQALGLDPVCVNGFTPSGHLTQARRPQKVLVASGTLYSHPVFWVDCEGVYN